MQGDKIGFQGRLATSSIEAIPYSLSMLPCAATAAAKARTSSARPITVPQVGSASRGSARLHTTQSSRTRVSASVLSSAP
jgi:hypothetical protein